MGVILLLMVLPCLGDGSVGIRDRCVESVFSVKGEIFSNDFLK